MALRLGLTGYNEDPVSAGLNSFGKVLTIANSLEEMQQRREDRPMEKQIRQLQLIREQIGLEHEQKNMTYEDKQREMKSQAGVVASLMARFPDGKLPDNYVPTEEEKNAMGYVQTNMIHTADTPEELNAKKAQIANLGKFWTELKSQSADKDKFRLSMNQMPTEAQDAWHGLFGDQVNKGATKYDSPDGNKQGAVKQTTDFIFDKNRMTPVFKVSQPVEEGQVFKHIVSPGVSNNIKVAPSDPNPAGLVEGGTIDLSKRPVVGHADGSISTVYSMSFEEDGKQVVVPQVSPEGKMLSQKEAVALYEKTGQHLGKFDTVKHAVDYAMKLHSDPMWDEDKKTFSAEKGQKERSYSAPATADRGTNPNAPVLQIPVPFFETQLQQTAKFYDLKSSWDALAAKRNPDEFMARQEGKRLTHAENQAASNAMSKIDTSKPVNEQRKQFITEFMKNSDTSIKDAADLAKTMIDEKQPKNETEAGLASKAAAGDTAAAFALKILDESKQGQKSETDATLAVKAAKGDKIAQKALGFIAETKRESKNADAKEAKRDLKDDAKEITEKKKDLTGKDSELPEDSKAEIRKLADDLEAKVRKGTIHLDDAQKKIDDKVESLQKKSKTESDDRQEVAEYKKQHSGFLGFGAATDDEAKAAVAKSHGRELSVKPGAKSNDKGGEAGGEIPGSIVTKAQAAINAGAPADKVRDRLKRNGYSDEQINKQLGI